MPGRFRVLGAIMPLLLLTACQTVTTELTPLHTFSAASTPQGKTFIMFAGKAQEGSLEWAQYSNLMAQKLHSKGLRQVDGANTSFPFSAKRAIKIVRTHQIIRFAMRECFR